MMVIVISTLNSELFLQIFHIRKIYTAHIFISLKNLGLGFEKRLKPVD